MSYPILDNKMVLHICSASAKVECQDKTRKQSLQDGFLQLHSTAHHCTSAQLC